jgi:hypothetical protein
VVLESKVKKNGEELNLKMEQGDLGSAVQKDDKGTRREEQEN